MTVVKVGDRFTSVAVHKKHELLSDNYIKSESVMNSSFDSVYTSIDSQGKQVNDKKH